MPSRLLKITVTLAGLHGLHSATLANDGQTAAALEHAVLDGKDIHVELDLLRCVEHRSGSSGPEVRGSLHPDEFMVQKDHSIAFAVTHFTIRPDEMPVNEFASFRVQPNGKVTLRSIFLNAASYAVLHEIEYDCEIGKGVTFY
jgi:VirK protein